MKQYKMLQSIYASDHPRGLSGREYMQGEIIKPVAEWQKEVAASFVADGFAIELKVSEPTNFARARTESGHFKADDPTTPDVNEAYAGGVAPKKKRAPRKKTSKKSDG